MKKWIESIEDGQTRCIFQMKYIEGMNWVRIAAKTGYNSNHDYPRIMIRDKYLKEANVK